MTAACAAFRRDWRACRGCLARVAPFAVLALSVLAILVSPPDSHYGLLLAVVPCLAAAVHGVHATAAIGALSVIAYGLLRYWRGDDDTDVWLIKLGFIVVASVAGVLISWVRVRERRLAHSREVALTLQEGLLPGDLPESGAVRVCHRYVPADTDAGVGGDWFDVIPLSGARVALVVGDVAGHGIEAAATMGRLRTSVHTLADLDLAPDEVLVRMDDLVARLGEGRAGGEAGAACLYLVYDPVSGLCTGARAGHPPPAVVAADGAVTFPDLPANPPLGLGSTAFESAEFPVGEAAVIALYTDGLLGLRGRDPDEATARLAAALRPAGRPLEDICDGVFAALVDGGAEDDIALLLARTRVIDPEWVAAWQFPATPQAVAEARAAACEKLSEWNLQEKAFPTELVVSELVTNAVTHACGPVGLRLVYDHSLICEVSDASSTSPHVRHARLLDEGGRGLYLIANLAERWGTRHSPAGKTIWAEQSLADVPTTRADGAGVCQRR